MSHANQESTSPARFDSLSAECVRYQSRYELAGRKQRGFECRLDRKAELAFSAANHPAFVLSFEAGSKPRREDDYVQNHFVCEGQ